MEVLDTASGQRFAFPCNRWLATDEDDGQTSRELVCGREFPVRMCACFGCALFRLVSFILTGVLVVGTATLVPYKVHVATGDKRGAGTSAEVFCVLNGDKGTSGKARGDVWVLAHIYCIYACLNIFTYTQRESVCV